MLKCWIIMEDKQKLSDKQKQISCLCLYYFVNWMRELINAFGTQVAGRLEHISQATEKEIVDKLLKRLRDLMVGLEERKENFDIIVGDLADPVEGGPCYQLYTKSFYEKILKPKLNHSGIFVTQAGPAGVFTHKEVFSSTYNTSRQVFKYVVVYTTHVPSFADTWGWVMASDQQLCVDAAIIDKKIQEIIEGELDYLNGAMLYSSTILNKTISQTLKNETHVYTEENA